MASKIKYIYSFILIILLVCLGLDILEIYPSMSFLGCAYFAGFIILALFLILRGLIYKIDTNLYFGILLLASPIIQIMLYLNVINYILYSIVIFILLAFGSFVVWKHFKDLTHKKAFFVFLGEIVILLIAFYLTNISFWYLILVTGIWFVLFASVNLILKNIKNR